MTPYYQDEDIRRCEKHKTRLLVDEDRGGNRYAYCPECDDERKRPTK